MVEEQIWQQRLDKQNNIIAAYQALYDAQQKELSKLEPNSLEYCRLNINQLQLEDEIEAKQLYALRIVQDKEQQEAMVLQKAAFAEAEGEQVLKALRGKISSPLTKGNEKLHYQALLKQANEAEVLSGEYNNIIFNIATALGLLK